MSLIFNGKMSTEALAIKVIQVNFKTKGRNLS